MTTRTPQPPPTPRPDARASAAAPRNPGLMTRLSRNFKGLGEYMHRQPGLDYLMIRLVVFLLAGLGVVMVFSSSMTWSIAEGSTAWGAALRQAVMVVVGLVAFWLALKIRPGVVRRVAPWLLWITLALLVAVLIPGIGTGREEVGSQSWIVLGPIQLQPSEIAKVTIAIWGASFLADRVHRGDGWRGPFSVFTLVSILMLGLIAAQGDVGMAAAFALTVLVLLIFAGVKPQWVFGAFFVGGAAMAAVMFSDGFRSDRFTVFFDALLGNFHDTQGTAFQSYQGFLSLADGSATGVGLGQSRAKWFYLPEAKNDFIFAIIGEELGLWGGALVILLFGALAVFGIRIALRAQNQFQALLAASLATGVVFQAFANIGYVIGLLPVTGIQLPMISAGGTSAVITLGAMGLLANCARHEPEAVSAIQSYGRPLFDRILFIGEPKPGDADPQRRAEPVKPARFGAPLTRRPAPVPDGGSVNSNNRRDIDPRSRPAPRARPDSGVQRHRQQRGRRH